MMNEKSTFLRGGDLGELSRKKGEERKDGEGSYKISSQPAPQPQ